MSTVTTGAVIARLMATRCHACEHSVEQRHLFHKLHCPNIESEICRECIAQEERKKK